MQNRLALVFLADQTLPAVHASLVGHLAALDEVERSGTEVEGVLIAHSPDPDVLALLRSVEGGRAVAVDRYCGTGKAWESAWPHTTADLVYLGTAGTVPAPDALLRLLAALADQPDAAAALPGGAGAAGVLVRRSALAGLARGRRALSTGRQPIWVVEALAGRLRRAGGRVVSVPGAALRGLPLTQQPTNLVDAWTPAQVCTAHPGAVRVGPFTYFTGSGTQLLTYSPLETIEIGSYCSIADQVRLVNPHDPRDPADLPDGNRRPPMLRVGHRPWTATSLPVGNRFHGLPDFDDPAGLVGRGAALTIGHDVWLGYGATVLGPVTVGTGAIVGAGAVVTRDVEPYGVVVGNPARQVRRRFDDATCEALLRIAWWDWTEEQVLDRAAWFLRPAEEFAAAFDPARRPVTAGGG